MKSGEVVSERLKADVTALVVAAVFLFGFLLLALRLRDVQVLSSADYGYASSRQSVRRVQTAGSRGRILDRHGVVLADNRLVRTIECLPESFQKKTWDETATAILAGVEALSQALGRPSPLTEKDVRRHIRQSLARPIQVFSDVTDREMSILSEQEDRFSGFVLDTRETRVYPQGALASHVLGYVGRDRGDAQAGDERFNFFTPEMRGRAGVELHYDGFLRGVPGEQKVLVDARGFAIREWTALAPQKGPDLTLTLDARIQAAAERVLNGVRGACVVLDPRSGDVLALASAPGFNPNDFVPILTHELYNRLSKDPDKPLLNRASGGAYAPGSTFKPVTALAALSLGFPAAETFECTGVFELGSMRLRCSSRWGHGFVDLPHALMKSCNPYFCHAGLEAGTNALVRTARAFGLGQKTGIDLSVDFAGVVPDASWKERTYHEKWYLGDVAQMSIGQGMLLVSPLQMARVAGALGTGVLVTPRLNAALPVTRSPLPFPAGDLNVVREGMRLVVAGDGDSRGTGFRAGAGVAVAVSGKTGTAEVGRGEKRRKNVWFIAYAPSENPTVAVALVVENGESGGGTAAPKVGEILKEVF